MQTWLVASHAMPVGQSPQARSWPQPSPIVAAVLAARHRAGVRERRRDRRRRWRCRCRRRSRARCRCRRSRSSGRSRRRSSRNRSPARRCRSRSSGAARCSADAGRAGAAAGLGRRAVAAVDDAVAAVADVAAVLAARRATGDDGRRARRPIRRRRQVAVMDVGGGVDLDVQRSVGRRPVHPEGASGDQRDRAPTDCRTPSPKK